MRRIGFSLQFERMENRKMYAGLKGDAPAEPAEPTEQPPAEVAPAEPATNSEDNDEGTGYHVTIYVDQPGEGGDNDVYEGSIFEPDVGHTYVEVVNESTGESETVGLYPSTPVGPGDTVVPGDLNDDSGHGYDVSATFPLTEEQYNDLIDQIEEDKKNTPDYDLHDNNCTDYALDLLDDVGIEIETDPSPYPWPIGGEGHNPGELGEDLVDDYNGERNEDPSDDNDGSSGGKK